MMDAILEETIHFVRTGTGKENNSNLILAGREAMVAESTRQEMIHTMKVVTFSKAFGHKRSRSISST